MAEGSNFLRNNYWVLRHGKSIPNEKGLVVSSIENGTLAEFGLASEGVDQARLAGELFYKELKESNIQLENVRICYSPFWRTTNTAKVVADVLGIPFEAPKCKVMLELRERFFGAPLELVSHDKVMLELRERFFGPPLELVSHDKYSEIWALDVNDPFLPPEGGESVADVAIRLSTSLAAMEGEFQGCAVLIVSHGDPLQILQTLIHATKEHPSPTVEDISSRIERVMVDSVLRHHRKFALLTGELRKIL